jgi:PAS domain S-box-containing protein
MNQQQIRRLGEIAADEAGDERILLLADDESDRERIAQRLSDRHELLVGRQNGEWTEFDLCLADVATYRRVKPSLTAHRGQADSYLPLLLLVPEQRLPDPEWLADELDGPVDDVIVTPASRHELEARTAGLLRVRRQSQRLALYRRVMDEANIGITISDPNQPDNPLVYVNDGFLELTGYDREEVIGRNCRFLQGPNTDDATVQKLGRAIDAEEATSVEMLNYRADGEPFWNLLTVTPIRRDDGTLSHYLAFQQDVTDRVERERALERHETAVETSTEPIYMLDTAGRFVQVNDALIDVTGYSRKRLLGSHVSLVATDKTAQSVEDTIQTLQGGRDHETVECKLVTAGGTRRQLSTNFAALFDDGTFRGVVAVAHDVTDLRHHQQRLSVLDRVLRHNVRNKMNVILGHARGLVEHTDPEVAERAKIIRQSADNLLELSENAREFQSAIACGTQQTTTVDIDLLVDDAIAEIRDEYPGARVSADVSDEAVVNIHETFEFALGELLENAILHGKAGVTEVEVLVTAGPRTVDIRVADNGPGLKDVAQRALTRGSESSLEHTQGIGLWLVRWSVEAVGGDIDITDNDPQGTVVTVSLPRAEE